jgi:excinuclease ABC subunit A
VEQSVNLSDGLVILALENDEIRNKKEERKNVEHLYSEKFSCPNCNLSLPEIEPRMFSFNSPIGACEKCKGIGTIQKVDPDLVLNPKLSINEGGIIPFTKFFFIDTWYTRLIKTMAQEEGISLDVAIGKLTDEQRQTLLFGSDQTYRVRGTNRMGKPTAIFEKFDGIVKELERRYFENTSDYGAYDIQKYMREELCDACKGAKLKPEVLAITIDKQNIGQFSNKPVYETIEYLQNKLGAILNSYETQVAKPIIKEIITRLSFFTQCRSFVSNDFAGS